MSRKKGQKSSKKTKTESHQVCQPAVAMPVQAPPFMNNPYMLQAPFFSQPQGQNMYPTMMQPQLAPNSMQFAAPYYPPIGMQGMPPPDFMYQQQPMAPFFMPQLPYGNPSYFQNMCPTVGFPPTATPPVQPVQSMKKKEVSSSSEEECGEDSNADNGNYQGHTDEEEDGPIEVVDGSSKNYGAIYKPNYSKPDDIDDECRARGDQGIGSKKDSEKCNSRKGIPNKATMSRLRNEAVDFYKSQKNKSKETANSVKSTAISKRSSAPKSNKSKTKNTKVTVKEEDFTDDSSSDDDFQPKKETGKGKKKRKQAI